MKYFVMLGDGMADYPCDEIGGKTPLEAADKTTMNYLSAHGTVGKCLTVPPEMVPESDTANLGVTIRSFIQRGARRSKQSALALK